MTDERPSEQHPEIVVVPRLSRLAVIAILCGAFAAAAFAGVTTVALIKTNDAVDAVQASRIEVCRQTNNRHDVAVARVNDRFKAMAPGDRQAAEATRVFTISLIDALAPLRDCVDELAPIATR